MNRQKKKHVNDSIQIEMEFISFRQEQNVSVVGK